MKFVELSSLDVTTELDVLKRDTQRNSFFLYQHKGVFFADNTRIGNQNQQEAHQKYLNVIKKAKQDNISLLLTPEYSCPKSIIDEMIADVDLQPSDNKIWVLSGESLNKNELQDLINLENDNLYIHFEDVYTFSDKNSLEGVSREIDNNQDLVYGRIRVVNKNNDKSYIRDKKLTKFKIKLGFKVSQQAVFIKRDTFNKVGGLDERYKIAADFDLLCKIFDGNYLIKKIDLVICNYDGDGVSSNLKKSYGDTALVIKNRYNGGYLKIYKIIVYLKLLVKAFL